MANSEKIIPFIFHFAAGVDVKSLTLPLERQFEFARIKGWSDDPDDPGGATMIDVTLKTYTTYRKGHGRPKPTKSDLRNISFAEWSEILKTMFWDKWQADRIESQGLANLLVDWVWASGPKTIRTVQRIIGVKDDGIVGPRTLAALNKADSELLFSYILKTRETYYRNCSGAWKYLRGWLRRLHAISPDGTFHYS